LSAVEVRGQPGAGRQAGRQSVGLAGWLKVVSILRAESMAACLRS